MTRLHKLLVLSGATLTLPLTVTPRGAVAMSEAQCEASGQETTCCVQLTAACNTLRGYYDKGCAGPCGEACAPPPGGGGGN